MAKPKQKYYVVWHGRQPGIYTDWTQCESQVKGFEGARYKSFPTRKEAEEAFLRLADEYVGKSVSPVEVQVKRSIKVNSQTASIHIPSLCVDAACSGNPGMMEYRGVYLLDIHQGGEREEQELFRRGPFPEGTNNIGEFLAIVHGLALLQQQGNDTLPVYSDSRTAQAWVRQKQAKTKLMPTEKNRVLFDLIRRAEKWLQTHTWHNPILKWDTPHWGEIPADFGRK
ncbi:MAG: ribonuclease H family protein [Paludibacteraceae bacterium]|nr:ribonuclease H family protein [Paludibacteraceae bacterium]